MLEGDDNRRVNNQFQEGCYISHSSTILSLWQAELSLFKLSKLLNMRCYALWTMDIKGVILSNRTVAVTL